MTIIAAADGSALGNPGPAGWAWYVDESCWACGGWAHGTNNMGELTGVLDLLQQTAHLDDDLLVYCDSTYVINSVTKWMAGWKRKGWKKGDGKPVMNVEIMKALDVAMQGRQVRFEWVKGHAGHELNEAADKLANAAALSWRDGVAPEPGPGFPDSTVAHPDAKVGQTEPEPDLFSGLVGPPEPTDEARVVELERALLSDDVRRDRAEVAAMLHPDWSGVSAGGRLHTRDEVLAGLAQGMAADRVSLDVVSIERAAPDTILLVWRSVADDGASVRSSLWVRSGARWLQRFHQGTPEA